jgi:hypothetical protein
MGSYEVFILVNWNRYGNPRLFLSCSVFAFSGYVFRFFWRVSLIMVSFFEFHSGVSLVPFTVNKPGLESDATSCQLGCIWFPNLKVACHVSLQKQTLHRFSFKKSCIDISLHISIYPTVHGKSTMKMEVPHSFSISVGFSQCTPFARLLLLRGVCRTQLWCISTLVWCQDSPFAHGGPKRA